MEGRKKDTEREAMDFSPIQQFYSEKSVFITGASGFVGKLLLEKLIRCCQGIQMIYILMRPKKGLNPNERVDQLVKQEIFQRAREVCPDLKRKITIIEGDLQKPRIGIDDESAERLQRNVQIVFHSAARVRWDDPLRIATEQNLCATRDLLEFSKSFSKLEVFVHVSTSYVHREPDLTVSETVTKMIISPEQLIDALRWMNDEMAEKIAPDLYKEKNNSYLFTKALTEHLILDNHDKIPTAIVRPCSISPTLKDPIPGWGDTIQGPQGLFLAAAKGFLRTLYSYKHLRLQLIPADTVVNTLIATAWYLVTNKHDLFVVNCVIDYEKLPLAGQDLLDKVIKKRDDYPLVSIYRYPDFTLYYNKYCYKVHALFDHYIPAVLGDTVLYIFTGKTLMLRLYRKIEFLFSVFLNVGKEPWLCRTENYNKVMNSMEEKDSEMFNMNLDDLNWLSYIDDMLLTGRRVLGKEDPSNIPYAKKKAKIWWTVTTVLKWCIILYFINYLLSAFFPDYHISNYIG